MMLPILVVDDDALMLSMLNDILQLYYPVLSMSSPSRAATIHPATVRGLLTDWYMEELGGLQLIQKMRSSRPDLPVVIISGSVHSIPMLAGKFQLEGGWENVGLVTKPFTIPVLLETIANVMGSPPHGPEQNQPPANED